MESPGVEWVWLSLLIGLSMFIGIAPGWVCSMFVGNDRDIVLIPLDIRVPFEKPVLTSAN